MPKKSRRQRAANPRPGAGQTRPLSAVATQEPSTATAVPQSAEAPARPVAPRPVVRPRPVASGRPGTSGKVLDYSMVLKEARRMAILAATIFVVLAIIGFVL